MSFEELVKALRRTLFYTLLNTSLSLSYWLFERTKVYYLRDELSQINNECDVLASDLTVQALVLPL